jgi:chromosome segregation ATPase
MASKETTTATKPKPAPKSFFKTLPVKLRYDELDLRKKEETRKLAELKAARAAHKSQEESVKARLKSEKAHLEELEQQLNDLNETLVSGVEKREVECVEVRNETDRTIETKRVDTDEVVESRPMTASERQGQLFPIDGGKSDAQPALPPGSAAAEWMNSGKKAPDAGAGATDKP